MEPIPPDATGAVAPSAWDLSGLVRSHDVRGVVPEPLSPAVAEAIGAAFATVVVIPDAGDAADATPPGLEDGSVAAPATVTTLTPRVVVGHDVRESGPGLVAAFARGLTTAGIDVVLVGTCSTDGLSYASGALGVPGAMFTAHDDTPERDGITLCRSGARPLDEDTGLARVRELAEQYLTYGLPGPATQLGQVTERSMLGDYAAFLRGLVDLSGIRPLKVVVDAGNGVGGSTAPAVLGTAAGLPALPLEIVPLHFEPDASSPRHGSDPLEPAHLVDLQAAVVEHGADIGIALDADGDRCCVVDELGEPVSPSVITALVGLRVVARERADGRTATVVHDLVTSAAVPDLVRAAGAHVVRTGVGRSATRTQMVEHDAVFGGTHSGHYSFRDVFFADTALLAVLHVVAALGGQPHPLSGLAEVYKPYSSSGELSPRVDDVQAARARVIEAYVTTAGAGPVTVDELDGLTVSHWDSQPQWWFTLRASSAEPVLRLTVEAADEDIMIKVRDDVLGLVRTAPDEETNA